MLAAGQQAGQARDDAVQEIPCLRPEAQAIHAEDGVGGGRHGIGADARDLRQHPVQPEAVARDDPMARDQRRGVQRRRAAGDVADRGGGGGGGLVAEGIGGDGECRVRDGLPVAPRGLRAGLQQRGVDGDGGFR